MPVDQSGDAWTHQSNCSVSRPFAVPGVNRTALLAGYDELLKVEDLEKEQGSKFDVSAASLSILATPAMARGGPQRRPERNARRRREYLKYLYRNLIWLVMQSLSCHAGGPPMAW